MNGTESTECHPELGQSMNGTECHPELGQSMSPIFRSYDQTTAELALKVSFLPCKDTGSVPARSELHLTQIRFVLGTAGFPPSLFDLVLGLSLGL
jgi:hypothetical protein